MKYISLLIICLSLANINAQVVVIDTLISKGYVKEKLENSLKTVLELDTLQKSNVSFKIHLYNTTDEKINIKNPLFSLETILVDPKRQQALSIKNINNLTLGESSGKFRIPYNEKNKAFEIVEIYSNKRKQELKEWYRYDWTILPDETITYHLKIPYVSALKGNTTCLGISKDQYQPIYSGRFRINFFHPILIYDENWKVVNSLRCISDRIHFVTIN